jgi:hypothetical protein
VHHSYAGKSLNELLGPDNIKLSEAIGDDTPGTADGYMSLFINDSFTGIEYGSAFSEPGLHPVMNRTYNNRTLATFAWTSALIPQETHILRGNAGGHCSVSAHVLRGNDGALPSNGQSARAAAHSGATASCCRSCGSRFFARVILQFENSCMIDDPL